MATALVVDDSALDRKVAGSILKTQAGLEVIFATNGREALAAIRESEPAVVLTDLQMPEMDGLQLVQEIRDRHPTVPVVLMTAHGSEEIANQALRHGAASYVPKRELATALSETVQNVIAAAQAVRRNRHLLDCLTSSVTCFELDNSPVRIPDLVEHLQELTALMKLCDETSLVRLGIALTEALDNALFHGNLEIRSELPDGQTRSEVALERRRQSPYKERRIRATSKLSRDEAVFVIRDDGPGFNSTNLPDPRDPANLEKSSGRGVLLMRTFMDRVEYNGSGNEVTLVKRREQ